MSSMGKLTFFLGLQVKQQPDGIFISQEKYVADILKKFDFCSIKTATTPIVPNIMFAVCACARFQVTPKASPLNAIKRILDSDYGGASLDKKSTSQIVIMEAPVLTRNQQQTFSPKDLILRATYGAELVSAASLVNTAKPTLSTARLSKFDTARQIWCCQANLVLPGKFGAARQIWCCKENLVLSGKFGAARQKFVLLVTVTTVGEQNRFSLIKYNLSMANLEFVDQHNMVACLEKTEGNSNFHEIVDFLASSFIHHALTVSLPIYTSYIEQFWNTASSQTVNDVKQINAIVVARQ
ncbi:putative ribonuclease H-like domain-containing protein [Tanacetum coccineum]